MALLTDLFCSCRMPLKALQQTEVVFKSVCFVLWLLGDAEESVSVNLAVPSTSPPTHGSPASLKETATPPSSPSMGAVLAVQG